MISASERGHLDVVKYLYENCHADVEVTDNFWLTPFSIAAQNGNLEVVKYLFEICHANVDTKDGNECTALYYAIINENVEMVKYLIETCHANLDLKDKLGNPLFIGTNNEINKYLMQKSYQETTTEKNDNGCCLI